LEASILQQAETDLSAESAKQVSALNAFFADMRRDISDAGTSAAQLLTKQTSLSESLYWMPGLHYSAPYRQLGQSVRQRSGFGVPSSSDSIQRRLAARLNTLKYLDFVVPGKLEANPDAVAVYFGGYLAKPFIILTSTSPMWFLRTSM